MASSTSFSFSGKFCPLLTFFWGLLWKMFFLAALPVCISLILATIFKRRRTPSLLLLSCFLSFFLSFRFFLSLFLCLFSFFLFDLFFFGFCFFCVSLFLCFSFSLFLCFSVSLLWLCCAALLVVSNPSGVALLPPFASYDFQVNISFLAASC